MTSERITWEEMVESYPSRWIVISNPEMDGPDVISGIVHGVKTDDEIGKYRVKHGREGYVFRRTTEEKWSGIIDADFVIETI